MINPDKDLLIFRMRIERGQATTGKPVNQKRRESVMHVINFEAVEEKVEKPLAAGVRSGIKKILEEREKARRILEEREKARIIAKKKRAENVSMTQKTNEEGGPPAQISTGNIAGPNEQINEIDESVDKVLDMLNKISEKQKVISKLDEV